jgi:hypothetical protein
MKRIVSLLIVGVSFLLIGFSYQEHLEISEIQTTINQSTKTIRYDFKIKNTGNKLIGNSFDYPGYHYGGMEIVVVPGKDLEKLMRMVENSKYKKMEAAGFGGQGFIHPKEIGEFHAEYFFKDIRDLEKIKKHALNGNLLILDGTNVIAELPLR